MLEFSAFKPNICNHYYVNKYPLSLFFPCICFDKYRCSRFESEIYRLRLFKPVRVCQSCHNVLKLIQAPQNREVISSS